MWPTAPASESVPVVAPRHSSTACHSGVTRASGSSQSGSWSTGKNVPENRNMGTTAMRMMIENDWSLSRPAEYAVSGAANARPPRAAAGTASTPHSEVHAAEQRGHRHEQRGVDEHADGRPR